MRHGIRDTKIFWLPKISWSSFRLFLYANMMQKHGLNLDTPVNFRGFDPDLPVRRYQRHLPHWRQPGATYFVTFRLAGYGECVFGNLECANEMATSLCYFQEAESLGSDATALEKFRAEDEVDEATSLENQRTEQPPDRGTQRCFTSCFCVMHNHVHAVMKPMDGFELEEILDSIKGFVSRKVSPLLGRQGNLWEQESYDRIIRDEEHLCRVIQYIGNNPAKAEYLKNDWVRWIHPHWINQGWDFRD